MTRFKYIFFFLLLFHATIGFSQTTPLKRKAALGISLQVNNDSIALSNNLNTNDGILVLEVLPGGSAEKLGLKTNDIIVNINQISIETIQDLHFALSNLRAEEQLSIEYLRNGKLKTTKGKAIAKPLETSDYADVYYEEVYYEGNKLRSILHMPTGVEKPPVIFYIQGYTCQSIDFSMSPNITIRKLIDDWVKNGYAVYRVEKPNIGDSQCDKGCMELNFSEEVEVFRQGYLRLTQDPRIDLDQIFIFGHSIGGIIAPVIASEFEPKGVITYGTVVNTWFEYMQDLTRVQGDIFGRRDVEVEREIRTLIPFWYALFIEKKSPIEILEQPKFKALLENEGTLADFENNLFIDRHYTYWTTIQDLALAKIWSNVKSYVLALHGEFDIQALHADHIYQIERIVNLSSPGKASAQLIKGADHGFVRFNSMEENIQTLNANQYGRALHEKYHEGIAQVTLEWMKNLSQ